MPRRNRQVRHIITSLQTACLAKRRFNSEQLALTAAEDHMLMNMSLTLRVYQCDYCHGWHLTRNDNHKH